MEPYTFSFALVDIRKHALSARPDAPVVAVREPRIGRAVDPTRRVAAVALRRLADRLEPCRSAAAASG